MKKSNTKRESGQPVYLNGEMVGEKVGQTLIKHVRASKHMLRFPKGWACNIQLLEIARQAGVTDVIIFDDESGKRYHAKLSDFWANGQFIERSNYGPQIVLTLEYWKVEESNHG